MNGPSTTCKKCNRVVFATDVDKGGLCVYCAPATSAPDKPQRGRMPERSTENEGDA